MYKMTTTKKVYLSQPSVETEWLSGIFVVKKKGYERHNGVDEF